MCNVIDVCACRPPSNGWAWSCGVPRLFEARAVLPVKVTPTQAQPLLTHTKCYTAIIVAECVGKESGTQVPRCKRYDSHTSTVHNRQHEEHSVHFDSCHHTRHCRKVEKGAGQPDDGGLGRPAVPLPMLENAASKMLILAGRGGGKSAARLVEGRGAEAGTADNGRYGTASEGVTATGVNTKHWANNTTRGT